MYDGAAHRAFMIFSKACAVYDIVISMLFNIHITTRK